MPNLRGSEWLILALLLVLLFGAKRLPDAARGVGRSLRIFKAEARGLADDSAAESPPPAAAGQAGGATLPPVTPPPAAAVPPIVGQATPQPAPGPELGSALAPQPPSQA